MSRQRAEHAYRTHHWGIAPEVTYHVADPDFPPVTTQMGFLVELEVAGRPGWNVEDLGQSCQLVWTPDAAQKLYMVLDAKTRAFCRRELWKGEDAPCYRLNDVNRTIGGRQARYPFRNGDKIVVQCLGPLQAVVYATEKKGDGPSLYRHRMGEDHGIMPMLCVDATGRLWMAGGSYTVPPAGITR